MASYGAAGAAPLLADAGPAGGPIVSERAPDTDRETEAALNKLVKLSKLVVPIFLLFGLWSVIAAILTFLTFFGAEGMFILSGMSVLTGAFGAWGVYKWGTVQDEVDRLKGENNKYDAEVMNLKITSGKLKTEVDSVTKSVDGLRKSGDVLNEQLEDFEALRQQLASIASDNQTINDMLTSCNRMFKDVKRAAIENERSHLLEMFYDVQFRDDDGGMSEREYKRFLARLPKAQRAKFEAMGTFQEIAGMDNQIDLQEFSRVLEKFLQESEEELTAEFRKSLQGGKPAAK